MIAPATGQLEELATLGGRVLRPVDTQPALRPIATSFLAFQDQNSTNWGLTSAAALFMVVPALLLFRGVQRRFVSGLTSGGLR